jgi:hypothetical protein
VPEEKYENKEEEGNMAGLLSDVHEEPPYVFVLDDEEVYLLTQDPTKDNCLVQTLG